MTPDFYTEHPNVRIFVEDIPANLAERPEYFRVGESARRLATKKLELFEDRAVPLPDGSKVLVLDSKLAIGPDTFTVREYPCHDQRSGCVEILAAKRDQSGAATVHSQLGVYEGGIAEFDFCRFNATFDFGPDAQLTQEVRVEQFYYPVIEGDPMPDDAARKLAELDWEAGLFTDSGRISV